MRQVLQDLRTGRVEVADVPCPAVRPEHLLIQTRASLISPGSERALLEFGRASWLARARSQPERVRQVLEKIRTDGVLPTLEAVFARLDEPLPLGYCNAGSVIAVGPGVTDYRPGDRVASNGPHAEMVVVPKNLCTPIPDGVKDEHAAFAILGAIALQGVRLIGPEVGERVAVIGLGLVGILAAQILRTAGCRVLGVDPSQRRRDLALTLGVEAAEPASPEGNPVEAALRLSAGAGVDGVLIAASAAGDTIVRESARMARKRGRIVLVGVVGLELDRREFYEKELSFRVSCSYGPGRYDPEYEDRGMDYPLAYVRWTEQRNLEAVLRLIADGRLNVAPLISRRLPQTGSADAYEALLSGGDLGIILEYPGARAPAETVLLRFDPGAPTVEPPSPAPGGRSKAVIAPGLGVIGAGQFARSVLLPAIRRAGGKPVTIAARGGVNAAHVGRRFGFRRVASDPRAVLEDPDIAAVFIATRHGSHADLTCRALRAGKHVYVEKPLAITEAQLDAVRDAWKVSGRHLMVGFNRRFAPMVRELRRQIAARGGPGCLVLTVNAGALPVTHWVHDPGDGGGRLLGEGVHWIDLAIALLGSRVASVVAVPALNQTRDRTDSESFSATLSFADGSIATVHYFANGSRRYPKERIEVFHGGRVMVIDNFRTLRTYGAVSSPIRWSWRQDKGHRGAVGAFLKAVRGDGTLPMEFEEIDHVSRVALAAARSLHEGRPITIQRV